MPSESRRRPRKQKFQGVPGIAGRDFPTLGSIPMTRFVFSWSYFGFYFYLFMFSLFFSFSCIGTNAGFYADLETNCQVFEKDMQRLLKNFIPR